MQKLKHLKIFEEIGFSYPGKEENKDSPTENTDESPLSLNTIENSYKKVARSAFDAGKKNVMSFDEWWNTIWNLGLNPPQTKKKTLARKPIGF